MTLRDRITAALATPPQPADVQYTDRPAGTVGGIGSEPIPVDQPDSTDLGALTDWSQTPTAGGWPDPAIETVEPLGLPDRATKPPLAPVRRWIAETHTFAAGDLTPRLVTPSGIDTRKIIATTLNGHADSFLIGPDPNTALVGFLVPINRPIRLEAGPVWVVAPSGGGQLAVATEWVDDE